MSQVTRTLHVTGMGCNSCVNHVKQALGELRGIEKAGVDLDREQVTVAYRSDMTSISDIAAIVRRAGYEVVGQVEPLNEKPRTACCGCCR